MLVTDRQTRPWLITSALLLIAGGAAYLAFQSRRLNGPSGSSWAGLAFGVVSLLMMTFAMLLALRKRWRNLRVGRTYWWMQGHVWLGLLSYPFAYFHSGFRWGMPFGMTWAIMALFTVVIFSGIVGLVLQQIIPRMILHRVKRETVYEQHDHVLGILRGEVKERMDRLEKMAEPPLGGTQPRTAEATGIEAIGGGIAMAVSLHTDLLPAAFERIRAFHDANVAPYMQNRVPRSSVLATTASSADAFHTLCATLPPQMSEPVSDIEEIVSERRQMILHRSLHRWLHLWLIVHVPISYALFVLAVLHAVYALRFV